MLDPKINGRAMGALGDFHEKYPKYTIALATIAGSQSFGTATDKSDIDIVGTYIVPSMDFLCDIDHSVPEVIKFKCEEYNAEVQMHEIKSFMGLLIQPNMNMMDAVFPYDYSLFLEKDNRYFKRIQDLGEMAWSKAAFPHIQGMTIHHRKHVNKYNQYDPKRQLYIMREQMRGILLFEKCKLYNNFYQMITWLPTYEKVILNLINKKKKHEFLSQEEYEAVYAIELELEQRMLLAKEFGPLRLTPQDNIGKLTKELIRDIRLENMGVKP